MTYLQKNRWFITSSKLKAYLECPNKYKLLYIDEIPQDETASMNLWTAAHLLISWGWTEMNKKYRFMEKGEKRTSKANEDEDRIMLTWTEWEKIMKLYEEVQRQPLFDFKGKYEHEKEIIFGDLKCTIDRLDVKNWIIRDLKFVAKLDRFKEDYFSELWYNYQLQAYFYTYVCNMVYNKDFKFIFDVVTHSWEYCCFEYNECWTKAYQIDSLRRNKEFKWKEFRDQCLNCSMYKHCTATALQKEPVMI